MAGWKVGGRRGVAVGFTVTAMNREMWTRLIRSGEDTNYIVQFEEMLAEIHQKLTECSMDETPVITTGVHHIHEYETFCVYANTIIGENWRTDKGKGKDGGGGSGKTRAGAPWLKEMPEEYTGMKCAAKDCQHQVEFGPNKTMISNMAHKKRPIDQHTILCRHTQHST